jgi:hypothetical protein
MIKVSAWAFGTWYLVLGQYASVIESTTPVRPNTKYEVANTKLATAKVTDRLNPAGRQIPRITRRIA